MIVDEFLKSLDKEVGFKFGTPWRYSDKSLGVIVPILREGYSEERIYITLEEAKDKGVKFKDSGRIDRVIIESSLGVPIFMRSGTILKGVGTQPRAVETSIVIVPEKGKEKEKGAEIPPIPIITRQDIPVRCIYASKGIRSGESFSYGGFVPHEVEDELLSRSGQGKVWSAVGYTTNRFMANRNLFSNPKGVAGRSRITSDNLVGTMEEIDKFSSNIDEILKKVPLFEDQVGAVFLDMKDVVGLELFEHPKSWEAIHKEVEKRLGESVAKEEDKSFFKPDYERVKPLTLEFLKKLIMSEKIETSTNNMVSTVMLKGDGVIGEATTINGKVIHLVGLKQEKKKSESANKVIRTASSINTALRSMEGPALGKTVRI